MLSDGALGQRLDDALTEGFDSAAAPGVAAHVAVPTVGVWFGARGVQDVPNETPIDASAVFRIGSITKTFTAAAILQLVEEGALSLSDPIDVHVPGWDFGPEVTIERLLNHTAGVYNYTDDPGFLTDATEEVSPHEVIDFALAHGELFEPGTDYTYSNTGYFLLGPATEAVDVIAVHDAARPLVTPELIEECVRAAAQSGGALVAVPLQDTVKVAPDGERAQRTLDRTTLWSAQTPQAFRARRFREVLRRAAADDFRPTDDAAV